MGGSPSSTLTCWRKSPNQANNEKSNRKSKGSGQLAPSGASRDELLAPSPEGAKLNWKEPAPLAAMLNLVSLNLTLGSSAGMERGKDYGG